MINLIKYKINNYRDKKKEEQENKIKLNKKNKFVELYIEHLNKISDLESNIKSVNDEKSNELVKETKLQGLDNLRLDLIESFERLRMSELYPKDILFDFLKNGNSEFEEDIKFNIAVLQKPSEASGVYFSLCDLPYFYSNKIVTTYRSFYLYNIRFNKSDRYPDIIKEICDFTLSRRIENSKVKKHIKHLMLKKLKKKTIKYKTKIINKIINYKSDIKLDLSERDISKLTSDIFEVYYIVDNISKYKDSRVPIFLNKKNRTGYETELLKIMASHYKIDIIETNEKTEILISD